MHTVACAWRVLLAGSFVLAAGLPGRGVAAEKLRFNRDVRPILAEHCYACHGPDKNTRKADLRLDDRSVATSAGAIAPGKPDESELVRRILSEDAESQMPPKEINKPLSASQKELLKRWIAEGAEYEGHWAYLAPVRPAVPAGQHPVDYFVQQELKKHGLAPSAEADRRTLIRRLSFDLTGLPPKPADVEAFVADKSPDAYEKVVELLLASPQFGERMAVMWLDVVRFADTIGYHSDNPRNVWPYRDYVIRSFNRNKPFDRFVREQVAGDLLPGADVESRVGSAFNRLLLTTEEGGAQAKDYEARMLTDRVRAVGTVFLGQTTGCAQCHDHKFDPIATRDFYALGAFFADIQEPIIGRPEDGMFVATPEQESDLKRINAELARAQADFDAPHPEFDEVRKNRDRAAAEEFEREARWTVLKPESATASGDRKLTIDANGVVTADKDPPGGVDTYQTMIKADLEGVTGLRIEAVHDKSLPKPNPGRGKQGEFTLSEVEVSIAGERVKFAANAASATVSANGFEPKTAIDGKSERGNGWSPGTAVQRNAWLVLKFDAPLTVSGKETPLVVTLVQNQGDNHVLGKYRLLVTKQEKPRAEPGRGYAPDIAAILAVAAEARTPQQKEALEKHFKTWSGSYRPLREALDAAKKAKTDFEAKVPRCIVSVSGNPRTVRILPRGNWLDESGEVMKPEFPTHLPGPKLTAAEGKRLTRLDLAEWIVSAENPLPARVFANRLWKQFFGTGLSKSLDDFGAQGEWPSHPELLDWLAVEFREGPVAGGPQRPNPTPPAPPSEGGEQAGKWDVKHLIRTIVRSRTYRQTSVAPKELLARDPENRLLARQSRYRLDAEFVRDNALAVTGLLAPTIGGPSVKPYQPDGYWENLNFPTRTWLADKGDDQHRRGLYTWWQRTFPHPSLLAFDAPSREECAADRPRSNIPQQALVLLNDPTYFEAARALARRILKETDDDDAARLVWAWKQVLQRDPTDDELNVMLKLIRRHRESYAKDARAAELATMEFQPGPPQQLLPPVELATWIGAARTLLNLHETITRQ